MKISDSFIRQAQATGDIVVDPWDPDCLGSHSYDVHLGSWLGTYQSKLLDAAKDNPIEYWKIPEAGIQLEPGQLYLGATVEYTESKTYLPNIDGKSSVGRLGISVHQTAGRGDVGFPGHWTLEIRVEQPVIVYAGMPIAQLSWEMVAGKIERPYGSGPANRGSYGNRDPLPQPSRLWRHFVRSK